MSSKVDTQISADEIHVEDSSNGKTDHTYDGSRNCWDSNIGHPITNDDDEDNWSRQVEMDDVIQRMPSSVTGGESNTIDDDEDGQAALAIAVDNTESPGQQEQPRLIPQPRPQPTMKEKLVERERQRRVESERARWKRQFAMAAHAEAEHDEDDINNGSSAEANVNGDNTTSNIIDDHDRLFLTDRNSVAGTVGEDTVAPIDILEEDNNDANMNYPMERFLQDQHGAEIEDDGDRNNQHGSTKNETQGVVMERFLQEQPTAPTSGFVTEARGSSPSSDAASLPVDSISNESIARQVIDDQLPLVELPSNDHSADDIESELVRDPIGDNVFQSPSQQPRVVLRLTEAEIQEMAAIDDASRSNAPPSERDDISELGELVSDFGTGLVHIDAQNMSQGTPVTALESVTSSVGNQIGQITILSNMSSDHCGVDGFEGHSISSNVVASSAGGDVSLTGNPPSEVARDDDDDAGRLLSPRSSEVPTEILPTRAPAGMSLHQFSSGPMADATNSSDNSGNELQLPVTNEIIVNRTIRPGLYNYNEEYRGNDCERLKNLHIAKKNSESQDQQIAVDTNNHIEGFDFNKNDFVSSPRTDLITTHNDLWSPGISDANLLPDYGATIADEDINQDIGTRPFDVGNGRGKIEKRNKSRVNDENKPLLGDIPPAVNVTMKSHRRQSSWGSLRSIRSMDDLNSLAQSVFSDIRSEGTATKLSISLEAEDYSGSTVLKRAFPERMFALIVTLIFGMPTFIIISGGSDKLCNLIGRAKYTTLVSLLPIVSAISGNVGLQASTLTTRAISHGQVKVENFTSWLMREIGTAFYLGRCCNCVFILSPAKV